MPIYKLSTEMTYEELLGWINYFERRPVGWREDDRTFKLLQAQGVKEKPWSVFSSLAPIYKSAEQTSDDKLNTAAFKRSALFDKLVSSVNGDKIPL